MITKRITFILGAGASVPYGYPTGRDLKNNIINRSKQPETIKIYEKLDFTESEVNSFIRALKYSAAPSVDAFLENQVKYTEIGKLAITYELAQLEDTEKLYNTAKGDWYKHIFTALTSGTTFENFSNNQLRFITLNYDRSLEHFLMTALKNTYPKNEDECKTQIESIPIIHVYGQIGVLPWQNSNISRSYKSDLIPEMIIKCSRGIKILHEVESEEDKEFLKAKTIIAESENIYFLGFGYHNVNIQRLGISNFDTSRFIGGTILGRTKREIDDIKRKSNNVIQLDSRDSHLDVLDFMRERISFN